MEIAEEVAVEEVVRAGIWMAHTICSTIEGKSDGDFASLSLESHMRPARSNSI